MRGSKLPKHILECTRRNNDTKHYYSVLNLVPGGEAILKEKPWERGWISADLSNPVF